MPFDIFKLRPTANTSEAIQAALDKVTAAEAEQATQLRQARDERDRLLLDGSASALAKAQAAVNAAVEPAEQTATMRKQLEHRLAAAVEAETIATVAALRAKSEATDQALSTWWTAERAKLFKELTAGMALLNSSRDARRDHDLAARDASEKYPQMVFEAPVAAKVDGHTWPYDLSRNVGLLDAIPTALESLLTAGDPKQGWV